jgi:hypothetical protein
LKYALHFLAQVVPLLVGVAIIPVIVQGLGKGRFRLLSSEVRLHHSPLTTYHLLLTPPNSERPCPVILWRK